MGGERRRYPKVVGADTINAGVVGGSRGSLGSYPLARRGTTPRILRVLSLASG